MLNFFRAVGQGKVEPFGQNRQVRLGPADCAQAQVLARAGGQDDVERAHFAHFFEQFARRGAEAARLHPLLERAPKDQRKKADENVSLGAFLFVVEDRAKAEVVFGDAKRVLDLREAHVGAPELFRASVCQVRAQKIRAVGPVGPLVELGLALHVDRESLLAFLLRIGMVGNLDVEQARRERTGS